MSRCPVVKGGKGVELAIAASGSFGTGASSGERLLSISAAMGGADHVITVIYGVDNSGSSSGYIRLYLEDNDGKTLWQVMLASTIGVSVGMIAVILEADTNGTATAYNASGSRVASGVARFRLYGSRTASGQFISVKA